jgi:DNA-3-methyladenine glycosylase II
VVAAYLEPMSLEVAVAELTRADPVLADLVARLPPAPFGRRREWSHFAYLVRAIVYQQVAGRSAEPIWRRVQRLVDGPFNAHAVAALDVDTLRSAGLTGGKARAISELASAVATGEISLAALARRPDDEVVATLSSVWGIGRWTAEMFLLLHLGRLDVWPVGDLAVRRGYARAWNLPAEPSPEELEALGERFRPWRSVVAWYCWRAYGGLTPTDQ